MEVEAEESNDEEEESDDGGAELTKDQQEKLMKEKLDRRDRQNAYLPVSRNRNLEILE